MDRLVQLLTKLAAAFPRDNTTEATLAVYVDELCHLELDTLEYVIHQQVRNARHFPTLAEIRGGYMNEHKHRPTSGPALDTGPDDPFVPMPPKVKAQVDALVGRMDERVERMEDSK